MKFRQQLTMYAGATGMTTLIAILASVHDQLIQVGPWVLDSLLAALASLTLYGGLRVYIAGRKHWLTMRSQELDVQAQEQQLRLTADRHAWELLTMQADIHAKAGRVYADPNGNYPILLPTVIDMLPEQMQGQIMQFTPGQAKGIGARQPALPEHAGSLQDGEMESEDAPAIRYEAIRHLIPPGQSCLGVNPINNEVETCDFSVLMTMWICGGSSTGKTNTVSLKINEAIENGRNIRLIVIDPHKEKADSLYNKIKRYEAHFLFQVASTKDEMYNALTWFKHEFERRLEAGTEGQNDILLIVDEVPRVVKTDEENAKLVKEIAEIAGTESRGFGMYGWFISQRAAGLSWLRNVVITVIAHKMNMMSERKLAANDNPAIARDMDHWPRGRVVVYGAEFEPKVLQMPLFTPPALLSPVTDEMEELQPKPTFPNSFLIDFQTEQWKRTHLVPETAQETGGNDTEALSEEHAATLKNLLQDIREKRAQGKALNTILRKDYGIDGGRAHQEVKALLDETEA
ncbi:MAG TPA: hypothetical protein VFV38_13500 [Ktedonobacteraceae bacterium]|nr:hypothetical protein [Ktedonobacteraceae bacterium]